VLIQPIDLKFGIHCATVYAKPRLLQPPVPTAAQFGVEKSFQNGVSGGNLQVKKHESGMSESKRQFQN
jgi:hypothetical protein